jgi:hypothetical protein
MAESIDSLERPTISTQNKRNRNNDDNRCKDMKKSKLGALQAEPEDQQEKLIWEIYTDSEEDWDSHEDKTP